MIIPVVFTVSCVLSTAWSSPAPPTNITATTAPTNKTCFADVKSFGFYVECLGLDITDRNRDKIVTFDEFYNAVGGSFPSKKYARAYFAFRDLNRDGVFDRNDHTLLFDRMDLDGNGTVTHDEYVRENAMLQAQLPFLYESQPSYVTTGKGIKDLSRNESKELLKKVFPSNGTMLKKNFRHKWETKFALPRKQADDQFNSLDTDGNGKLTMSEIENRFDELDVNGDQMLQWTEIIKLAVV